MNDEQYICVSRPRRCGSCRWPHAVPLQEKIEKSPEIDVVCLTEGSALIVQVKSARQELDQDLERLQRAEEMIVSDPDVMRGSTVYRASRIPVQLVADMLNQGATPEEIVEGYPALDKEKVAIAPFLRSGISSSRSPHEPNPGVEQSLFGQPAIAVHLPGDNEILDR